MWKNYGCWDGLFGTRPKETDFPSKSLFGLWLVVWFLFLRFLIDKLWTNYGWWNRFFQTKPPETYFSSNSLFELSSVRKSFIKCPMIWIDVIELRMLGWTFWHKALRDWLPFEISLWTLSKQISLSEIPNSLAVTKSKMMDWIFWDEPSRHWLLSKISL